MVSRPARRKSEAHHLFEWGDEGVKRAHPVALPEASHAHLDDRERPRCNMPAAAQILRDSFRAEVVAADDPLQDAAQEQAVLDPHRLDSRLKQIEPIGLSRVRWRERLSAVAEDHARE